MVGTTQHGSAEHIHSNLLNGFKKVTDQIKQKQEEFGEAYGRFEGSTCTTGVLSGDNLVCSHLGDSPVILFVVDGESGAIFAKSLLKEHNARNKDECDRMKELIKRNDCSLNVDEDTGYIRDESIGFSLAVSRAFGDHFYSPLLIDTPETTIFDLNTLLPNKTASDRIFLCVASDGLLACNKEKNIANPLSGLSQALHRGLMGDQADLARCLVEQAAHGHGSYDNISALVVEVTPAVTHALHGNALVLAVADGHGGDEISQLVIDKLGEVFSQSSQAKA